MVRRSRKRFFRRLLNAMVPLTLAGILIYLWIAVGPGGGLAYYWSCADARRAGVAPMERGEPGYRAGLDADLDGVACEGRI